MKSKHVLTRRTLWRDPHILPHHDGIIPRNKDGAMDGGKIPPSRILMERPSWSATDIAYYLGYPDDVIYDPEGRLGPVTLYSLNRVIAAEELRNGIQEVLTA